VNLPQDADEEDGDDDEFDFEDGFLANEEGEDDDEDGQEQEGEAHKTKKKQKQKRDRDLELDEDDYDLLEENTGVRVERPAVRRLKKARDRDGAQQQQFNDAEDLQADLFGTGDNQFQDLEDDVGDEGGQVPGVRRGNGPAGDGGNDVNAGDNENVDDIDDFLDDEDAWIIDEEEEAAALAGGEEAAREARRIRRERQERAKASMPGVDFEALEEAHAIFGDVDEYMEILERQRQEREDEEEDDVDDVYGGLDPDDFGEGEAAEELRAQREERRKKKGDRGDKNKALHLQMDPEAAARHFLLPSDDKIRETDVPEREQIQASMLVSADVLTSDECATWIWRQLVSETESRARTVLEDGIREVDGPPPAWMGGMWPPGSLRNGLYDTSSCRGLYQGRFGNDLEAWLEDPEAQDDLKRCIKNVLVRRFRDHEEIPYIAMYRKGELGELLCVRQEDEPADSMSGELGAETRKMRRWDILYAVNRLALKYSSMSKRKDKRREVYDKAAAETAYYDLKSSAAMACSEALDGAATLDALDDIESKFKAAVTIGASNEDEAELTQGKIKRVQKGRFFKIAAQAGLQAALDGFSIRPGDFADNVQAGFKLHEPEDPALDPAQHLDHFVDAENPVFADVRFVVKSAVRLMAYSLSSEPAVRKAVREQFWARGVVSTSLQAAGITALNAFHPLGIAKRIKNKPLETFKNKDTFLRLTAAEQEGFVKIELTLANPEEDMEAIIAPLQDLYVSDGISESSQAWNDMRRDALRLAVEKYIMPAIRSETRRRLAADAMEVALQETADNLWNFATKAPVPIVDDEGHEVHDKRIMAAVYGAGDKAGPPSTVVLLDQHGTMIDFLHLPQLSGFIPKRRTFAGQPYSIFDDPKKNRDAMRFKEFVEAHLPHALVVGMGHPEAKALRDELHNVIERVTAENTMVLQSLETGAILKFSADESIAMAWENSHAAEAEMPSSPPIIRRAVALARLALDPLAVLASTCGQFKEILTVRLHELEKHIPKELKGRYIEEVVCTAVSQSGVDLNMAVSESWKASLLPFVPGMGYRKSAALIKAIGKMGGALGSRASLLDQDMLGPVVFRNAAPYLMVTNSTGASLQYGFDIIDNSRIHPDDYDLAFALASDIEGTGALETVNDAIEYTMENRDRVELFDLAAFALKYAQGHAGNPATKPAVGEVVGRQEQDIDDIFGDDDDDDADDNVVNDDAGGAGVPETNADGTAAEAVEAVEAVDVASAPGDPDPEAAAEPPVEEAPVAEPPAAEANTEAVIAPSDTTAGPALDAVAVPAPADEAAPGNVVPTADVDAAAPEYGEQPVADEPSQRPDAAAETVDVSTVDTSLFLTKLIDIRMELVAPASDIRPIFKDLSNEDIFWMLAGEEKSAVKIGRKIEAKIRHVSEEAAAGNIPELNNAEALIEAAAVSSKQQVMNCRDYFRPGDTAFGVIIAIDTENAVVYLSTASTQLNADVQYETQYLASEDPYYVVPDKETLQEEEARLKGVKAKPKITVRPIRHPYFKNVTAAEATAEVLAGPVGVAVIRPAAKSFKRLYITMHMPSGMVLNVGIKELGSTKSNLTLAGPLEVEPIPGHKFEYEDLDELVVRFIDPIAAAMRALSMHRKWRGGPDTGPAKSWEEIQDELRLEKESASFTGYCLAPDVHRPGAFFIAHHIGSTPRREYFVVLPDGFYFRKKMHGTVDSFLASFKNNPFGSQPPQAHVHSHAHARAHAPDMYAQDYMQPY